MPKTHIAKDKRVVVRPLKAGDDAEWLRLRYALWPHHTPSELEQEMARIRANLDREMVFVAEYGDEHLCGMIEVSIHRTAKGCQTNRVGYLEGWFVDPERRERGIGRKLVEAAEAWARSLGCTEMASDTTSAYPLSPLAHARLGYQEVERCYYYRKTLALDEEP